MTIWEEFLAAHGWQLVLMGGLLGGSAFFSGTETALFSLTRGQLMRFGQGGRLERLVASIMQTPGRTLNTLLLGNMLVNVAYASLSAVMIFGLEAAGAPTWATVVASLAPLLALILLGEVTPKMLALVTGERWATLAATPVAVLEGAMSPVLRVLEALFIKPITRLVSPPATETSDVTAEELAAVLDLSAKRGILDHDANSLLQEILELTGLRVRDVMVPRVDMIACDVDAAPAELSEMFRRTHLRKVPVYEGSVDRIVGVVHAKRLLLGGGESLRDLCVTVPFVPEAANLERVLLQFRVTQTQMAVVVDEYGGTAGLVTLEDVLEEIVGDIPDPHEPADQPAVRRVSEREYLLDGNLAIHEWQDAFKIDLGGARISTVGGFVLSLLGRIPHVGEAIDHRNLRFVVESMRGRRIATLRLLLREDEA